MDAIAELVRDHKEVRKHLARLEKVKGHQAKQTVADQLVRLLSVHSSVEEQLVYPLLRAKAGGLERLAFDALEQHHVVKVVAKEIERISPGNERFDGKLHVLSANVLQHLEEEEQVMFPALRKLLGPEELNALADLIRSARAVAPTHPHPLAPDTPPGNIIAGTLARVLDQGRDLWAAARARAAKRLMERREQVVQGAKRVPQQLAARRGRVRRRR